MKYTIQVRYGNKWCMLHQVQWLAEARALIRQWKPYRPEPVRIKVNGKANRFVPNEGDDNKDFHVYDCA